MSKPERPAPALESLFASVEKPARYTGGEWNRIRKDPARVRARAALAFPDVYEIGMSYLGQKILYDLINAHPDFLAERVFAPWPDFERALRAAGLRLPSLENKIPLAEFDVVGFSLLYELNYTNVLTMLELGGIPLRAADRSVGQPIVIAGGPAVFNPEPVAEFFDLVFLGDGEEAFLEILSRVAALRDGGTGRGAVLRDLASIPGVYVPSFYEAYRPQGTPLLAVRPLAGSGAPVRIRKRVLRTFTRSSFPEKIIVPNLQAVFDRVAVEVARGCPQKCRFCQATNLYAPYRVKDPGFVVDKVLRSLRATGYEDASLFSLSVSDYPYLDATVGRLMDSLEKDHVALSLSSLRPRGLSPNIVRNINRVRKTGFTLVPEAGSERLRRVINKDLGAGEVREAAANAFREGWKLIKLYFMIGLPTETEADLEAIVRFVEDLTALGRGLIGGPPRINMSVSSFIPKPHTPFQWAAMDDEPTLREKQAFLRGRTRRMRHVEIKDHPVESSVLEGVFARGDRRLAPVLLEAWRRGARFDSWKDFFAFPVWAAAFEAAGIDLTEYLGALPLDVELPWDHLQTGVRKAFLRDEYEKALREEPTPSCLETACGRCGGCEYPADLERVYSAGIDAAELDSAPLGRKTESVHRYLAVYAKEGPARFFGHNDLLNVLQRAFKRARVDILYSEGFHPKMLMSYVPALPLGMEGREEAFEFKSAYAYGEEEFVAALNRAVPPGISFSALKTIDPSALRLNDRLSAMAYSFALDAPGVAEALAAKRGERGLAGDDADTAELLVREHLTAKSEMLRELRVDREAGRVVFTIAHTSGKPLRPQDVAESVFGVSRAVHVLVRERILYH
jgi:radical SAM family uncharacterized protein/radical SAM-linked protein